VAVHNDLGAYAYLTNHHSEGLKVRLAQTSAPTEPVAEFDFTGADNKYEGYITTDATGLTFLPLATSDLLAFVSTQSRSGFASRQTVSIFDITTGDVTNHLSCWTVDLEYKERRTVPSSYGRIIADPVRPFVFYVAGEYGIAYYDLRINTSRALRFVRTGQDKLIEFKIPEYGPVNTMLSLIEDHLCFYDIGQAKIINAYKSDDGMKSVTHYGKQVALGYDNKTEYFSLDGGVFKPFHTDEGYPLRMWQLQNFWNRYGSAVFLVHFYLTIPRSKIHFSTLFCLSLDNSVFTNA